MQRWAWSEGCVAIERCFLPAKIKRVLIKPEIDECGGSKLDVVHQSQPVIRRDQAQWRTEGFLDVFFYCWCQVGPICGACEKLCFWVVRHYFGAGVDYVG